MHLRTGDSAMMADISDDTRLNSPYASARNFGWSASRAST